MIRDRNFLGFSWHALWLALAETFAEKNTVLPGLILLAGGTQNDIGILTSIMIGVPLFAQLIFAGYLTNKTSKKKYLLWGIYLRVFAYTGVALSIYYFDVFDTRSFIIVILFWMFLFATSGAFAGISYADIVGKSFDSTGRKRFFVFRQFLTGIGIFISAFIVNHILTNIEYPNNYQIAFFTAGGLLLTASIGFLLLKERPSEIKERRKNLIEVLRKIPSEIKANPNLKYFVLSANLIGFTFVLIPFYIGYINNNYTLTESDIGTFLMLQITGMILSNFLWHKMVKLFSFKGMFRIAGVLLGFIPLLALLLGTLGEITYFYPLFLFTGSAISAQKIAQEGIIIEISNESNRPLYVGIFGTLNLSSAIFPILLGLILEGAGYTIVFILLSLITFSSLAFIKKMVCPIDLESA